MAKRSDVAVIAHRRKVLGGGLDELRKLLTDEIHDELIWYEVPKSRKAPKKIRKALDEGAKLIFVWGGDGMVQRCVDTLAGTDATMAILPAGTANLFATNLGIPEDLAEAVRIGLHGTSRTLDLGKINGEHFAVMAGAGFDGHLIKEADRGAKEQLGRLAYVWTGLRHIQDDPAPTRVVVDGTTWFEGDASCVLFGNVSTITGGIKAFDDAKPDDGWLDVGVATSQNAIEWARTLGRMALGRSDRSPFVQITRAKRVDVRFSQPTLYELDGGDRSMTRKLKAKVVPGAITVRVP
ncbi:diacylglycerol/lipid kinase family protein [Catenuloplanes atrovinosus]|uniref:YegS/Rv2252/BmrU family lipid kinase n=1 Tax=Catenuloplanes atrovinosus TaxID=137266 RepID=A0AAE4CCV4_9ACTN|nr:YegS/Rv2252/BmrU family lipid kinase [Catenuloplanes atrovinosus]MDR7278414.1 YegS/Rv2252/BmrU family lipid kinase [Catenuloplanes atrovinosus]